LFITSCRAESFSSASFKNNGSVIGRIGITSIKKISSSEIDNISRLCKVGLSKVNNGELSRTISFEVFTDSLGYFIISNLEAGEYKLQAKILNNDSTEINLSKGDIHENHSKLEVIKLYNSIIIKNDSISVIRFMRPVIIRESLNWNRGDIQFDVEIIEPWNKLENYFLCDFVPLTRPIVNNFKRYCGYSGWDSNYREIRIKKNPNFHFFPISSADGIKIDSLGIYYCIPSDDVGQKRLKS